MFTNPRTWSAIDSLLSSVYTEEGSRKWLCHRIYACCENHAFKVICKQRMYIKAEGNPVNRERVLIRYVSLKVQFLELQWVFFVVYIFALILPGILFRYYYNWRRYESFSFLRTGNILLKHKVRLIIWWVQSVQTSKRFLHCKNMYLFVHNFSSIFFITNLTCLISNFLFFYMSNWTHFLLQYF